jgi:hypothetical protein
MAELKADNLGQLAGEYAAAVAAYNAEQTTIDVMNDNLIATTQNLAAITKQVADSSGSTVNVPALRAALATAITAKATADADVTAKTATRDTKQAALDVANAAVKGYPLNTLEQSIKDTLSKETIRNANYQAQIIMLNTRIQNVDSVAKRNAADAAVVTAQNAYNAAALAFSTGTTVQDSINAEFYFRSNNVPNLAAAAAAGFSDPNSVPPGLTCWDYTVAGVHNAYVPFANAVQFQNLNPSDPIDNAARAAAQVAYNTMFSKDTAFVNTEVRARALVAATLANLNAKKAIAAPFDTWFNTYTTDIANFTLLKNNSSARIAALNALVAYIENAKINPPPGDANLAALTQAVTDATAALATANTNLTNSKTAQTAAGTAVTNARNALAAGITAWTLNKPFDQQDVAYMTLQIADMTAQIASEKIILAQDLAVVNMWLAKIQTALQ